MKKFVKNVMAISLAGCFLCAGAANAGDKVTLEFANVANQSGKEAGALLKKLVNDKTGGTLDLHIYNDNSYGDDRVAVESVMLGEIDMVNTPPSPIANMMKDLYMYDAPFIFDTPDDAFKWADSNAGQKLNSCVSKKGLKLLGVWQNGFRNFTNNKVAVKVPDQIKNMKVRTMENDIQLSMWKGWGSNPTPMAFTEVLSALQQGTIDAQENPLALIDSNHFYEVQKYISLTGHVYSPHLVMINQEKFDSLSKEHQEALLDAMQEATKFQRRRAVEIDEMLEKKFTDNGNVIVQLSKDDKEQWREKAISGGVYDLVKSKMEHPEFLDVCLKREY